VAKIIFSEEAKEEYEKLKKAVERTREGTNKKLLNSIEKTFDLLAIDPCVGVRIRKNKIPYRYIKKYGVNNLRKINLIGYWRIIYTLRGNKVEIISMVLNIFDHKKYDKLFGYK